MAETMVAGTPQPRKAMHSAYAVTYLAPVADLPARLLFSGGSFRQQYTTDGIKHVLAVIARRFAERGGSMELTFAVQPELNDLYSFCLALPNVTARWVREGWEAV